jgi:hypothetical protein
MGRSSQTIAVNRCYSLRSGFPRIIEKKGLKGTKNAENVHDL